MKLPGGCLTAAVLAWCASALAEETRVVITEPFVELRTGPGRGFPVFHVAARDEMLILSKQRTGWIKAETTDRRPVRGWIRAMQLTTARTDSGGEVHLSELGRIAKRFEWAVSGGDFEGASSVSTSIGFRMTPNLSLHGTGTQILGEFSNGWLAIGTLRHQPFPAWRLSPWFELGGGLLSTEPFSSIVQASDRQDNALTVGAGLNVSVTRQFTLFFDYHRHTILTSRDENEEINEWKLGITVSF